MLRGNAVLVVMAAVWCELGFLLTRVPVAWFLVPPLVSAAVFLAARRVFARLPARSAEEQRRIGRLVGLWSAAEGIAFAVVGTVLTNTGSAALIPAALAVIVGAHFLPLARGMPNRLYYATGTAMIAAGAAGVLAPGEFSVLALTVACGAVLWVTATGLVAEAARRGRG